MAYTDQIHASLAAYIDGAVKFSEIPEDILSMLEEPEEGSVDLAESIQGLIALYAGSLINEDSFRNQLRPLFPWGPITVANLTGEITVSPQAFQESQAFGTKLEMEYV